MGVTVILILAERKKDENTFIFEVMLKSTYNKSASNF